VRIAVVTTSYPQFPGDPSGHFVEAEARALAQRGEVREVHVVHPHGIAAFGWPGFAARVRARPWRAIGAAAWMARARSELHGLGGARFDRIVAHWAVPCAWPIALPRLPRVAGARDPALEVVSHGGDVRLLIAMPQALRARVVSAIAARASWRFVSAGLVAELTASLPRDVARRVEAVARVEACAIAMPLEEVRAAIAEKRALGRVAVCVARLVPSKRVDAAIAHASRAGMTLVVVGDGPERARLEALASSLRARVQFVGRVKREEALAWIGAAETVLHASKTEGASTVLREAEALGVPVTLIR